MSVQHLRGCLLRWCFQHRARGPHKCKSQTFAHSCSQLPVLPTVSVFCDPIQYLSCIECGEKTCTGMYPTVFKSESPMLAGRWITVHCGSPQVCQSTQSRNRKRMGCVQQGVIHGKAQGQRNSDPLPDGGQCRLHSPNHLPLSSATS